MFLRAWTMQPKIGQMCFMCSVYLLKGSGFLLFSIPGSFMVTSWVLNQPFPFCIFFLNLIILFLRIRYCFQTVHSSTERYLKGSQIGLQWKVILKLCCTVESPTEFLNYPHSQSSVPLTLYYLLECVSDIHQCVLSSLRICDNARCCLGIDVNGHLAF